MKNFKELSEEEKYCDYPPLLQNQKDLTSYWVCKCKYYYGGRNSTYTDTHL